MTRNLLALALTLALAPACGASEPAPGAHTAPASVPAAPTALNQRSDMSVSDFQAKHAEGVKVLDVRTVGEYTGGHVPGAVNVPLDQVSPQHPAIAALNKDEPVYVICASGRRSAAASDQLASAGFKAVNILGGTNAWAGAGLPLEK